MGVFKEIPGKQKVEPGKIESRGDHTVYSQECMNYEVSFNVDWVPEDQREWLRATLSRQIEAVVMEAYAEGREGVQRLLRLALDGR